LQKLTTMENGQTILQEEVHRYNYQQVHSTMGEVPAIWFAKRQEGWKQLISTVRFSQTL
jgi:hypothetical protein